MKLISYRVFCREKGKVGSIFKSHVPPYRLCFFNDEFIYSTEHEIKDTTETERCASYLDLHLDIDSKGGLRMTVYRKRDDIYLPIVIFPFMCSKIPTAPVYLWVAKFQPHLHTGCIFLK